MKKMTITIMILVGAWFAPQAVLANPPGVTIKMKHPMQRRIARIAMHNGKITLAGESLTGEYGDNPGLEAACMALPEPQRYSCPESFVYAHVDALRRNDLHGVLGLYEAQYSRQYMRDGFWAHGIRPFVHNNMLKCTNVQPYLATRWDNLLAIAYNGVCENGKRQYINTIVVNTDPMEGRYWLTEQFERQSYPSFPTSFYPRQPGVHIIKSPPRGTRILRLSVNWNSPARNRTVTATELADRSQIAKDNLILYVRDEPFPADAPPFLEIDPAALDKAGRRLQKALKLTVLWQADDKDPLTVLDELASMYHPVQQEMIRKDWTKTWTEHHQKRINLGISINGVRDIPQLRIASRVFTNNGIVWFAWAPKPGAKGPDDVIVETFIQERADDGAYGLISSPVYVQGADHSAVSLVSRSADQDYNGVIWPLTRLQRETQLGKPGR